MESNPEASSTCAVPPLFPQASAALLEVTSASSLTTCTRRRRPTARSPAGLDAESRAETSRQVLTCDSELSNKSGSLARHCSGFLKGSLEKESRSNGTPYPYLQLLCPKPEPQRSFLDYSIVAPAPLVVIMCLYCSHRGMKLCLCLIGAPRPSQQRPPVSLSAAATPGRRSVHLRSPAPSTADPRSVQKASCIITRRLPPFI